MQKIAVYGQFDNHFPEEYVTLVLEQLKKHNKEVYIETSCLEHIKKISNKEYHSFNSIKKLDDSFDFLISIGGDGTILRAVSYVQDLDIPIIGVNTGRLGFLATIQKDKIESSIKKILDGNYSISERTLLTLKSNIKIPELDDCNFALNEIAVSRKNTTSMIMVKTLLDDKYLTSYWADGLIVATPTGSTGYSLSCGGPVVMPNSGNFVLTPIAPHNLNARPLIIPESTTIKLYVSGREKTHLVSLDSKIITVENETELIIQKANFKIKMIEPDGESFLNTLRNKLLWGEDKRN